MLEFFLSRLFRNRYRQVESWMKEPIRFQNELLQDILYKGNYTEFGRNHHFSAIRDYESFIRQVPVRNYPEFQPWIERMRKREENVLWPGLVDMFSKSSGTTSGKSKYIPVTHEYLEFNHIQGASDTLSILYNQFPNLGLFEGKNMIIGGSLERLAEYPGIVSGDISALLLNNMPWYARQVFVPSIELATAQDWEFKLAETPGQILDEPLVMFAGVPTWLIVLFKNILQQTGKENLLQIWPGLKLYIHGGVNFGPVLPVFKKLIPSESFLYQEVYNASEGYFATRYNQQGEGMLLLLNHAVFYEFKDLHSGNIVPVEGIRLNTPYHLIITNNCGLWRYDTGDVIECTGLDPVRIKIAGRTTQFINAFGEEVIVENAEKALEKACGEHQCMVTDFTAGPKYMDGGGKGAHEWIIEFEKSPSDLKAFARSLDLALQSLNSDYEAKRTKNLALEQLIIHEMPRGFFYSWMKSQGKLGGQHKVPRLKNDRSIIDAVLQFYNHGKG
ncbi:MAG TPA: GH3 auxin-responsive promoter family protein [Saprospiraceae bacterium]|nr:GH3 auxin-responsive promoter family protein [Saprospiraceae bacterium]HNT19203.1 GH3 auxin-responsive promoter family protein [Saprospiraceae bacterium]